MRFMLHLLALIALLVAPLAVPASAMVALPSASECSDPTMNMAGHDRPASEHGQGEACCIAVPPAIDPPPIALNPAIAIEQLAFLSANEPFRLGASPKAEDPPPRTA